MGYIAHDAIIAASWHEKQPDVEAFRQSLPEEWQPLVVGPISSPVNSYCLYAFLPDGSKEGWHDSDRGDEFRKQFVDLFKDEEYPDIISVRFGGDFKHDYAPHAETLRPEEYRI